MLDLLELTLLRANLAAALAIIIVLPVRELVRRLAGCAVAYRLWVVPLFAAFASTIPGASEFNRAELAPRVLASLQIHLGWSVPSNLVVPLAAAWTVGASGQLLWFAAAQGRSVRAAQVGVLGPAVIGALWPRGITPTDFAARFTPDERRIILAHEQTHIARGDPAVNLLLALLLAFSWFNPFAHLAAGAVRFDQELACDAEVLGRGTFRAREYALALLKARAMKVAPGLGWRSQSGRRLAKRLETLRLAPSALDTPTARIVVPIGSGVAMAVQIWTTLPILQL